MYFNMMTGEKSNRDGDAMLSIMTNWFPYHNLEKEYVGFKCQDHFAKPNGNKIEDVDTYEEMNW